MRIVSLLFCVLCFILFNGGLFCHVLCSCMRKKLVTELRRVPIKILGICFTFWPVPKNYQKKIKIIKLYFIKKKITKSKSVESLSILWWLWIYHSFETRPGQVIGSRIRWVDSGWPGSTQKNKLMPNSPSLSFSP